MRIVTWNCNRQLGRKLQALLDLAPDIAVVQEWEKSLQVPDGFTYKWTGVFPNMGLGVLARDPQMRTLAYDEEWTFSSCRVAFSTRQSSRHVGVQPPS